VLPRRQVLAVVIGNGLEYYDFVTYAFFASQIGRNANDVIVGGLEPLAQMPAASSHPDH